MNKTSYWIKTKVTAPFQRRISWCLSTEVDSLQWPSYIYWKINVALFPCHFFHFVGVGESKSAMLSLPNGKKCHSAGEYEENQPLL